MFYRIWFFAFFLLSICVISCDLDRVDDVGPFVCGQTFVDPRDGKSYKTVWIANDGSHNLSLPGKCWMAENLNFDTDNNESVCYEDQDIRCDTFGRLYTKPVLENICMNGWHIATNAEWNELFTIYGWSAEWHGFSWAFDGPVSFFLPAGTSKLDFEMGGSCSEDLSCQGIGQNVVFWTGDNGWNLYFEKTGSASNALLPPSKPEPVLRYYVRCIQD